MIMLEYNDNMVDVTENDINYLNASVKEINDMVGREFISIASTPEAEDECVDIFQDSIEDYSRIDFEQAELYLKGVKQGLYIGKYRNSQNEYYEANNSFLVGILDERQLQEYNEWLKNKEF